MGLFYLGPLIANLVLAFTDWSGYKSQIDFVGLQNFRDLAARDLILRPVLLTLTYAIVGMVSQTGLGLILALALERSSRINTFFRSAFFLPVLLSSVAVGFIWRGYLEPQGPFNALLGGLVGQDVSVAWLAEPAFTIVVVALIDAWKFVGFSTLVFIAGLIAIPTDLKEAARVDGATSWQVFRFVKWPLLGPAVTFNVVIALIGALSAFDTIMATTRGGPGTATTVLNVQMLRQYASGLYGFATSTSLTIAVLVVLISVPLIVYLRRREVGS
jgi:raffinose/stachyose/melibiose transport system permease protein